MLRFISLLLITILSLVLSACGGGGGSSQNGYHLTDPTLSPDTLNATQTTSTLSVLVTNPNNSFENNATVTFTSDCSTATTARASIAPTRLIGNGQYQATYTNSSCSGIDTITATATIGNTKLATQNKLTIAGAAQTPGNLTITAANTNVPADGQTQTAIRVLVSSLDTNQPMSGVTVNFSTTLGTLSSANVITDSTGYAQTYLISSTNAGTATISASSSGIVRTTSVGFGSVTPPARLIVTATPGRVDPQSYTTIQANVLDATGAGVANVTLTFEVTTNISGGSLTTYSGTTNSTGQASVQYKSGTSITDTQDPTTGVWIAGYDVITVNTNNNINKTVNVRVNNTATTFNTLTFTTGGANVPADNSTLVLLSANVVDKNRIPVVGAIVGFTTTLGTLVDLTNTPMTTATTGADGTAKLYLKAGSIATSPTVAKVSASYLGTVSTNTISFY